MPWSRRPARSRRCRTGPEGDPAPPRSRREPRPRCRPPEEREDRRPLRNTPRRPRWAPWRPNTPPRWRRCSCRSLRLLRVGLARPRLAPVVDQVRERVPQFDHSLPGENHVERPTLQLTRLGVHARVREVEGVQTLRPPHVEVVRLRPVEVGPLQVQLARPRSLPDLLGPLEGAPSFTPAIRCTTWPLTTISAPPPVPVSLRAWQCCGNGIFGVFTWMKSHASSIERSPCSMSYSVEPT